MDSIDVTYEGHRGSRDCVVTWRLGDAVPSHLSLYLDKVNHSPTGFEWGYYGSGPSQLAFAILYSYLSLSGREHFAKSLYMRFKQDFIAPIRGNAWTIGSDAIEQWLSEQPQFAFYEENENDQPLPL